MICMNHMIKTTLLVYKYKYDAQDTIKKQTNMLKHAFRRWDSHHGYFSHLTL